MSSNEGLDVDDLDVEVPTAAYMAYNNAGGAGLVPYLTEQSAERNTNVINRREYRYPLELVRREDHEEALREAVQHGREQKRRRIQDKMSDLASKHWGGQMKAFEQDWRNAWKELSEELEEEVEKNQSSRPKTEKSDNFGETDK